MKFISLGNNCAAASVIKELDLRTESYPFDWVPGSSGVILHCLETELRHFLELGNPQRLLNINEEYLACQGPKMTDVPITHQNYYGCHFVHYKNEPIAEVKEKFKRRCDRFLDALKGAEPITFLYTNEYELYFKGFREKVDEHYELIKIIEKVLVHQYNLKNFTILCVNVNKDRPDTEHITNIKIDWVPAYMFDDGCNQTHLFWEYKEKIKAAIAGSIT